MARFSAESVGEYLATTIEEFIAEGSDDDFDMNEEGIARVKILKIHFQTYNNELIDDSSTSPSPPASPSSPASPIPPQSSLLTNGFPQSRFYGGGTGRGRVSRGSVNSRGSRSHGRGHSSSFTGANEVHSLAT